MNDLFRVVADMKNVRAMNPTHEVRLTFAVAEEDLESIESWNGTSSETMEQGFPNSRTCGIVSKLSLI